MTKENIYDLIKAHATELVDGRFRFKKVDLKEACAELEDCFKRLHKPVVVRGVDNEANTVSCTQNVDNSITLSKPPNTPTEPLATEAGDTGVSVGCECDEDWGHDAELKCFKCGKLYRD